LRFSTSGCPFAGPRILEATYGLMTVFAAIGMLVLPLVTGLIQFGGD